MPLLKELVSYFDSKFPTAFQENYDNSGLLYGDLNQKVTKALVTIDINLEVAKEAKIKGCNLIISHHPLVFKAVKSFTTNTEQEKALIFCIQNDISILCLHTNVDNHPEGINGMLASMLQVEQNSILKPFNGFLKKLAVFVPEAHADTLRSALFNTGAGEIGKYDFCSYNTAGLGTFRAGKGSNPFVGNLGEIHTEQEIKIEVIFPSHLQSAIVKVLNDNHPYEEVAYDIYPLDNKYSMAGAGLLGELGKKISPELFLNQIARVFDLKALKYAAGTGNDLQKIAICSGSGAFLIEDAIRAGADAYITGDLKYHDFQTASGRILCIDIGHYESEIVFNNLIIDILNQNFYNFAADKSECYINPVCVFSPIGV
ncbi:MAG: Nif3-like dinuclear metal center hexameric protein [Bacteroidales bacterium]|nr:Nif3-like dinuclear metal center hexameric protein [Bacteroidales bacterium]